jgi:hypothetical protein
LATSITVSVVQFPLRWKRMMLLDRVAPNEPLRGVGVVLPADLQGDQALVAEVDRLDLLARLQVPEVQVAPVLALGHVGGVEATLEGVGGGPLAGDEGVLARLIPEVVRELHAAEVVLPALGHREVAGVEHRKAAGRVAVGVAEHRDGHDVAWHAVDGVRGAQPQLLLELLALDDVLDRRRARVGDVEQVDPRGPEPGDDQRVARELGVARRRAGVEAEVVQLIADVGHVGAVHDRAVVR